jgi:hypothetical protein
MGKGNPKPNTYTYIQPHMQHEACMQPREIALSHSKAGNIPHYQLRC